MLMLRDANGKWVCIKEEDFMEALVTNHFTILGMTLGTLCELRNEYLKRGGNEIITEKSIKEVFSN